jgi:hypothetical protein
MLIKLYALKISYFGDADNHHVTSIHQKQS